MTLTIELEVESGSEAARVLRKLADLVHEREAANGDGVERKVLRSGIYELGLSELRSIDIL